MHNTTSKFRKLIATAVAAVMLISSVAVVSADTALEAGTYPVDATLSCYVNAMGGVEFSDGYGLVKDSNVVVDDEGDTYLKLDLGTTTGLSIYGVACTAFIGTDEAPGYYKDGVVTTEGVTYTVSTETANNASGAVNYIDSITFPVSEETSAYTMWLYLDSNVMGCQLGDGSGTGASNTPGVVTKHTATVTIDWDSIELPADEETTQDADVEYTVEGGYEVEIPSKIVIDPATKTAAYKVLAKNFVLGEGAYVTVTTDGSGELAFGENTLAFTNALATGTLTTTGDELAGTVTVTDAPSVAGTYTGVINFVIKYFAN